MGIGHGPVTCLEATRMLSSIDSLRFYSLRRVMCDCPRLLTSQGSEKGKKKVCCENDFRWHVNIYIFEREFSTVSRKRDAVYGSIQYCLIVFEFLQH